MKKFEAIKHFGTQQALADAVGVTLGAVWQWKDEMPVVRQAHLEILTGGALKADVPNRGKYKRGASKAA